MGVDVDAERFLELLVSRISLAAVSLVFACIAPHGDLDEIPQLRAAMEELGRRFDAAGAETAIVVTPHNVHVERHFAVVTAANVGEWETDRETAAALLRIELPILGVSYGGNLVDRRRCRSTGARKCRSTSCARSGSSWLPPPAISPSTSTFAWERRSRGCRAGTP